MAVTVYRQPNESIEEFVRRFTQKVRQEKLLTKTRKDGRNRTRFAWWNRKKHRGEW